MKIGGDSAVDRRRFLYFLLDDLDPPLGKTINLLFFYYLLFLLLVPKKITDET